MYASLIFRRPAKPSCRCGRLSSNVRRHTQPVRTLLNFAYGSNMLSARFRERAPSATPLFAAQLRSHSLAWHKRGRDGSGKCDVLASSDRYAVVHGVVYELSATDKPALDKAEGLGAGYEERAVTVMINGSELSRNLYYATAVDSSVRPFTWYKALVVAGAREHSLPAPYIAMLEQQEAKLDADLDRHRRNLALINAA